MWRNALFATAVAIVAGWLVLMGQITCLIPYKKVLLEHWRMPAGIYTALLALNLFVLFSQISSVLQFKTTGEKLAIQQRLEGSESEE